MKSLIRFVKNWRSNHPTAGWFIRAFAILVGLYVVSYLPLTLQGVYGWGAIGTNGVKYWVWYPQGFGFESRVRAAFLRTFYLPLHGLDIEYWHTEDRLLHDKYLHERFRHNRTLPSFDGFPP